jgi:hypothetical protein
VLTKLGFIPRGGESFEGDGYRFTVMEMDRKRVSRVKIKLIRPSQTPAGNSAVAEGGSANSKSAPEDSAEATAAGKGRPRK